MVGQCGARAVLGVVAAGHMCLSQKQKETNTGAAFLLLIRQSRILAHVMVLSAFSFGLATPCHLSNSLQTCHK